MVTAVLKSMGDVWRNTQKRNILKPGIVDETAASPKRKQETNNVLKKKILKNQFKKSVINPPAEVCETR